MAYPTVEPQPSLPRPRGGDPRLLGGRQDVRGLRRGPAGGSAGRQRVRLLRRPAVRQRPAALRPPAHRLREGRGAPLPDDAGPPGRAALRLGLPRAAGRGGGREGARPVRAARRSSSTGSTGSTRPAARRSCATPTSGSATSPARPAGSTSTTTTRRSTSPTWRASCGPSSTLWDKGLIYEGFRVLAYCWRCETPLSNTETRMDDVYRDRQDPALTVWFELETRRADPGLDHDAVDAAVQPRPRRRSRHRLRGDGGGRAALHPGRGPPRRLRAGARPAPRGSAR